ncbi:hypothetical protein HN51_047850 [Arachis hypogaea]|nr:uncharacterized protein DS421_12g370620 [Arachis hypogaea]
MFGFTVVLPHNFRGLELVAHGPIAHEERVARQEVAFNMLEKILSATGHTIRDYNYRILGRLEERLRQCREKEIQALEERLRCLEAENEELRKQVDMFMDMLEE